MRRRPILAITLLLTMLISACAIQPAIDSQTTVYVDNWVKRNHPQIYVQPMGPPPGPYSALILPFRVTQDIDYSRSLGTQITEMFWQAWTGQGVFPTLYYDRTREYINIEQAIAEGRRMGVNAVVVGDITYLMSGGSRGETGVSLKVDIFDVSSGQRIWSMAHAGRMEAGLNQDYILFRKVDRMPLDPVYSIVTVLARDMGDLIKNWNFSRPEPDEESQELMQQEMEQTPQSPPPPPASQNLTY
ncbi:hypothetical protein [Desulfovibrio inopinatus]|uniref:hypothetical protein n=1 Tax=Desulfovibrio inopinatus TaxID=102109 RepID=UPI00041D0BB1|nr:hypothetical protein [Desulfovibrio inopinatus]